MMTPVNPAYLIKPRTARNSHSLATRRSFEKLRAGFKADIAHPCSQNVVNGATRAAAPLDPAR